MSYGLLPFVNVLKDSDLIPYTFYYLNGTFLNFDTNVPR